RRHRYLAPHAHPALLDLVLELRLRRLVAAVLGRDLLERRADDLLVDGVARGAAALLGELFVRGGGKGRDGERDRGEGGGLVHDGLRFVGAGWELAIVGDCSFSRNSAAEAIGG